MAAIQDAAADAAEIALAGAAAAVAVAADAISVTAASCLPPSTLRLRTKIIRANRRRPRVMFPLFCRENLSRNTRRNRPISAAALRPRKIDVPHRSARSMGEQIQTARSLPRSRSQSGRSRSRTHPQREYRDNIAEVCAPIFVWPRTFAWRDDFEVEATARRRTARGNSRSGSRRSIRRTRRPSVPRHSLNSPLVSTGARGTRISRNGKPCTKIMPWKG